MQKKHSRVKLLDSDEEEEQAEQTSEREQIAQDLFDQQDEDDVGSVASSRPASRLSDKYQAVDVDEEGEDEEDIDDFIVDDDDQPINKAKKKKKSSMSRYTDRYLLLYIPLDNEMPNPSISCTHLDKTSHGVSLPQFKGGWY